MAFPETINAAVHTTGSYAWRGTNPMNNAADGIFADRLASEPVTLIGSPTGGYQPSFRAGVTL